MRIDIGTRGTVVGTKHVDDSGRVSGLERLAGRDVLVLAPDGLPVLRPSVRDRWESALDLAEREARRLWSLSQQSGWARRASRVPLERLGRLPPARAARDRLSKAELWSRARVRRLERRVDRVRRRTKTSLRKVVPSRTRRKPAAR